MLPLKLGEPGWFKKKKIASALEEFCNWVVCKVRKE
jgi:hypothetical protein